MNVIITGRHLELTSNLKEYAKKKIEKFKKYLNNIAEATITLSVEKYRHKAEILLKVNGLMIQAESVTGEMYSSIDEAMDKLERQVKKYKKKWRSYRKVEEKTPAALKSEEFSPAIIKKKSLDIKPMPAEEAAMQMVMLDKSFFVFTNASSGSINVLYKRKDGNLGLIEPPK
ncbi:MAG: ribosome-associated translation inhibitor RaiA [Thermodesulfovibrionia bacterium]